MELINNNNTNFKLTNLKFTKYHFMSGEIYNGCPIKTSVEIKFDNYNLQTNKDVATLCIVHTYFLGTEEQTNFQQYELENSENIIKSLEQIDFKNLKNNYFSNDPSQRFSHWELEYNNYFKIPGTFDNEIDEIKEIKKILNFEQIEKQELEKVDAKFKNTRFAISIRDAIGNFMHKMQTALDIENGLLNDTITFDIENENEFIKLTEGLRKLYNISNNKLKFNNVEQMKLFLIDWLKKIEEVNKLVDEEIEKYNMAVKNNLPTEDQTAILDKIKKLRCISKEENYDIETIKMKAKKMYSEIDSELNLIVNEYLKEWSNKQRDILEMTLNFLSKVHDLKGFDINDEVLKCEKINMDTISSILNVENKYVSELVSILNTIAGKHGDPYKNTINEVIPYIAKQIDLKTHENSFVNYLYANLYDKLSNDEINEIIDEIKLERGNEMNDELKVNNNVQFDSEETKQEFSNYIDEINEYNRKIKNGEETDVNPADLLNKYREKFYDEELENKMKEIDNQKENFKIENNETDELLNKIDQRISELDEEYKD